MISLEKLIYFDTFTKMPKNVGDWGKLIGAKGYKTCPKCKKIALSGHTAPHFEFDDFYITQKCG